MADTLREFLVSIGYRIDAGSEAKFKRSVETVTKGVIALGAAVAAMQAATAAAVTKIASGFDDLYYASQRTKASAENIKSLSFAVSQLGGSYQGTVANIESFAQKMRANPGVESLAKSLGVVTRENGKLRDTTKLMTDVARTLDRRYPGEKKYIALQYLEQFGIDERTYDALRSGDLTRYMEEFQKKQQALGVDQKRATEIGRDLSNAWRSLAQTAAALGEKLLITLGPGIKDFVDRFDAFLMRNSDRIVEFFKRLGELADELLKAFVQLVEKGEGPAVAMFDKIVKALDGAKTAFELFATFLAGAFLLSVLASFSKVGAGFAGMLLRLGINPTTFALGMGAYGVSVIGDANKKFYAGVEPGQEHNTGRSRMHAANEAARQRIEETRRQQGEGRSGDQGTGWWGWVKRKLGFGSDGSANSSRTIEAPSGPASANYMNGQHGAPGENLTQIRTPSGKTFTVHRDAAPAFLGLVNELEASGYKIDSIGGYANRSQANGSGRISQHAYGNAIDINPGRNPYRTSTTDMPSNISEIARRHGLVWGGNWSERNRDPMHFEWSGKNPELAHEPDAQKWPPMVQLGKARASAFNEASLSRIQANAGMFGGFGLSGPTALMPGASGENGTTIMMSPRTEITVLGGSDPQATGAAVADAQNGVNGRLIRNLQGAVR